MRGKTDKTGELETAEIVATEITPETAEAAEPITAEKSAEVMQLVYIGPTIQGTELIQNRTFIGGYPESVTALKERFPYIGQLFVAPADLAEALKEVARDGAPFNTYFKIVQEG